MITLEELRTRCDAGSFDQLTCLARLNNDSINCSNPAQNLPCAKQILQSLSKRSKIDDVRNFVSCATCEVHCDDQVTARTNLERKLFGELKGTLSRVTSGPRTPRRAKRPPPSAGRNSAPAAMRTTPPDLDDSPSVSRARAGSAFVLLPTVAANPFDDSIRAQPVSQGIDEGIPVFIESDDGGEDSPPTSASRRTTKERPIFERWPPLAPYCHRRNVKKLLQESCRPRHVVYVFKVLHTEPVVVKIGLTKVDPKDRFKNIQKDHDVELDEKTLWCSGELPHELAEMLEGIVHADLGAFRCNRVIAGKTRRPSEYFECTQIWAQSTVRMWEKFVRYHWSFKYKAYPAENLARKLRRFDADPVFAREQSSSHVMDNRWNNTGSIEDCQLESWRTINADHGTRLKLWEKHLLRGMGSSKTAPISKQDSRLRSGLIIGSCVLVIAWTLWDSYLAKPTTTVLLVVAILFAAGQVLYRGTSNR